MKKMLFCAAAAIVALASCSKTQVVYDETPQEISFKKITGAMTKETPALGEDISLGVFATYTPDGGTSSSGIYLNNIEFTKGDNSYWTGRTPQYYPLSGTLDFVGYAPYNQENASYNYTPTTANEDGTTTLASGTLTLEVNNTPTTASLTQQDVVYSLYYSGVKKQTVAQDMHFHHALAKINVNVELAGEGSLTINNLVIKDTRQTGTLTVTHSQNIDVDKGETYWSTSQPTWSETGNGYVYYDYIVPAFTGQTLAITATTEAKSADLYVIPSAQTSIVLNYTLPDNSTTLSHEFDLSSNSAKWDAGCAYTYNIIINNYEIKFNATQKEWEGPNSYSANDATKEDDKIQLGDWKF